MIERHQIFDRTLWLGTILTCSLGLLCATMSGLFSFVNIFVSSATATTTSHYSSSPNVLLNGPMAMYFWNSLAGMISKFIHFI